MAPMRRWLAEALAEYRRHPWWVAAGLSVIAIALAAAGVTGIMRQLAAPSASIPAGTTSSAPAVHHPPASHRTPAPSSPPPSPAPARAGKSRSCGCLNEEAKKAYQADEGRMRAAHEKDPRHHGLAGTPLYYCWHNMIKRCYDPDNPYYHAYGGRGIRVCERWMEEPYPAGLKNFIADMSPGWAKGLQLDRIRGNEGYGPENCQWLTQAENARKVRPKIRNADYEALIAENERLRQRIAELETNLTALVRLRTARAAAPWHRERRAAGVGPPAPPLLDPRRDRLRIGPRPIDTEVRRRLDAARLPAAA